MSKACAAGDGLSPGQNCGRGGRLDSQSKVNMSTSTAPPGGFVICARLNLGMTAGMFAQLGP